MDKAQRYLGLARKAGLLATGADGCADAIASGKAKLLMLASDASPNTAKRARSLLNGHRALLVTLPWEKETLSAMLGKGGCAMVCFTDLALASRFAAAMAEDLPQWAGTAELLARREEKAARRKAAPRKAQIGGTE